MQLGKMKIVYSTELSIGKKKKERKEERIKGGKYKRKKERNEGGGEERKETKQKTKFSLLQVITFFRPFTRQIREISYVVNI